MPELNVRGISSDGRAPASHAGGTGIDTQILQDFFFVCGKVPACNYAETVFQSALGMLYKINSSV